jgi:hypothetical protein
MGSSYLPEPWRMISEKLFWRDMEGSGRGLIWGLSRRNDGKYGKPQWIWRASRPRYDHVTSGTCSNNVNFVMHMSLTINFTNICLIVYERIHLSLYATYALLWMERAKSPSCPITFCEKTKHRGRSPQTKYTDRATAACRRLRSGKPKLTAVGIRCADHATPSTRYLLWKSPIWKWRNSVQRCNRQDKVTGTLRNNKKINRFWITRSFLNEIV